MKRGKWIAFGVALGMIIATAGWLGELDGRVKLGRPGVAVDPPELYNSDGSLVSNRCVVLPADVQGFQSQKVSPTDGELAALPVDTTFGRRYYVSSNLQVQLGVVLMGTDHTSIHQPQYCLYAQGWTVTNQERISLHMKRPHDYEIPAIKLSATQVLTNGLTVHCTYIYWFVSGDKITAEEGSRLFSQWRDSGGSGTMERWAYISYFAPCLPDEESANLSALQKFIEATVPEIQTITGEREGGR